MLERTGLMTIEEYIRLYDEEGPFELVDAERIAVNPTVAGHNVMIRAVFKALDRFVEAGQLGEVFNEASFVLVNEPDWVTGSRLPDVLFIGAERFDAYKAQTPDWASKPFIIVPDLVVEVISKNDRYSKINEKVGLYLSDGVRLVWVIDPQQKSVSVHRAGSDQITLLSGEATLTGGDVLPGFELELAKLFE